MFFKFIDVSRTLLKCNCTSQKFMKDKTRIFNNFFANFCQFKFNTSRLSNIQRSVSYPKRDALRGLQLVKKSSILLLITKELRNVHGNLKDNSVGITKNCVAQFEFVIAHRLRRGQQMFSLYSKLWDERALRVLISRFRRQFLRSGRTLLMCSAPGAIFQWEKERIEESELTKHFREIEMCHMLLNGTESVKPPVIKGETKKEDDSVCVSCESKEETTCWQPFVTKEGITVWKREAPNRKGSGLFCYKMYGKYDDVTAYAFLSAFLDIDGRKTWDSHVVELRVIDSEAETNSDVIYWETKWPSLFSNRDYIFKRRYKIFPSQKLMVVCNKGTSHPSYPVNSSKTRVTEYWSYIVIKPLKEFDKPGIEFSLTYFDNPGASLPSSISLWVSSTGMPEYLRKLHLAALRVGTDIQRYAAVVPPKAEAPKQKAPEAKAETPTEQDVCEEEDCCQEDVCSTNPWLKWLIGPSEDDSVIFQLLIS